MVWSSHHWTVKPDDHPIPEEILHLEWALHGKKEADIVGGSLQIYRAVMEKTHGLGHLPL